MTCKQCMYNNRKKYLKTMVLCPESKNKVLITSKFCVEKSDER